MFFFSFHLCFSLFFISYLFILLTSYSGTTQFTKKPSESYKKMWVHTNPIPSYWQPSENVFSCASCLHLCSSEPRTLWGLLQTTRRASWAHRSRRNGETLPHSKHLIWTCLLRNCICIKTILFTGRRQPAVLWRSLRLGNGRMCFLLPRNLSTYVLTESSC